MTTDNPSSRKQSTATERLFPIMAIGFNHHADFLELRSAQTTLLVIAVPWAMLQPHEQQAQRNHSQSLERLAARGGISASEALAILEDRRHKPLQRSDANRLLCDKLSKYRDGSLA